MTELVTTDKQAMSALKQHGAKIVWAIVIALAGYFGWQFYQKNYAKVDTVAADSYAAIAQQSEQLTADGNTDPKTQESLFADIDKLANAHGDSVYAWQALMIKARQQSDMDDLKGATQTLQKAVAVPMGDEGLTAISRLQLAQVLLADNDIEGALKIVNEPFPKSFEASRLEALGDIHVAKKDSESAKTAYTEAWKLLTERHENRALLGLKLQALGVNPEPIEPKYAVVANSPAQTHTQEK